MGNQVDRALAKIGKVTPKRRYGTNDFSFHRGERMCFVSENGLLAVIGIITSVKEEEDHIKIEYEIVGSNLRSALKDVGKSCIAILRKSI